MISLIIKEKIKFDKGIKTKNKEVDKWLKKP